MEEINVDIGSYSRPIAGEVKNGDTLLIHHEKDFIILAIIDGIGHGEIANAISSKVKEHILQHLSSDINQVIENAHNYMKGSLGATIGIGVISKNDFYFGSLGNITCKIINENTSQLLSTEGLLGVRGRTTKVSHRKLKENDIIVMYSDGVSSAFLRDEYLNYHLFSSDILAKKIIRQYGSNFDDASLITVKIKR